MFGSVNEIANAMGISPSAVRQFPEILDWRRSNELTGTAIAVGISSEAELVAMITKRIKTLESALSKIKGTSR